MLSLRALTGSSLVNGLALAAALAAPGALAAPCPCPDRGFTKSADRGSFSGTGMPRLFLFSAPRPPAGFGLPARFGSGVPDRGCADDPPVDRDAAPDFPLFGADRPFAALPATPRSPAFCVLIGGRGRVLAAFLAGTSGDGPTDAAMLKAIRRLRFEPAERGGRPVAVWHRLIVNQPGGLPLAGDEMREPPYSPPTPRPVPPIILPPIQYVQDLVY